MTIPLTPTLSRKGRGEGGFLLKKPIAVCVVFAVIFLLSGVFVRHFFNPDNDIPYSSVFYDRNGKLLRLTLAEDGQYRLPISYADLPEDAIKALTIYEDRLFFIHDGIDYGAFTRAFGSVFSSKRTVGGSTLSMQTARLLFGLKTRSVSGKFLQTFLAKLLEFSHTKEEILTLYFTLAPYGHNISGIEAASLIYFHKPAKELTLPEILSLTLIPQNPALRRPTTENGLLRLRQIKPVFDPYFDSARTLPVSFYGLSEIPFEAPHLTTALLQEGKGIRHLTLDLSLQKGIERQLTSYLESVSSKGIYNGAVLIADWRTHEVLAFVGSADYFNDALSGQVNGVFSYRSPGSALKPFVYALGIEQGLIHPYSMLKDLPKHYGVYTPENFDRSFMGALTAQEALMQSRNVPAVDLLLVLQPGTYYRFLQDAGITPLKPESFYGLALALGGFEITMAQAASLYTGLANLGEFHPLVYEKKREGERTVHGKRLFSKEAGFLTLSMLRQRLSSVSVPVYYKTGTSFGYKDAWTTGIVGPYVVVVWFGNFDGSANPAFLGRTAAAPFFHQLARFLSDFKAPLPDLLSDRTGLNLVSVPVCRSSGDLAGPFCPSVTEGLFIPLVSPARVSTVYRAIPVVKKTGLRACYFDPVRTEMKVFEFWPSDIAELFSASGFKRQKPPPFEKDCDPVDFSAQAPHILSPLRLDYYVSDKDEIPFKAAADTSASTLFWFLNDRFIGVSKPSETLFFKVPVGTYTVTVSDDLGRAALAPLTVQIKESY